MKYKFKWEKWEDPLKAENFEEDLDPDSEFQNGRDPSFKALPTPFGLLTITNHILASTRFDFWMLHTNFPITHELEYRIKQVPGVETINVLTRYRCRFGFPVSGLFDVRDIKHNIENTILKTFEREQARQLSSFDATTTKKACEVMGHLDKYNKHWALYVLPNGHMEVLKQNSTKDTKFNDRLDTFKTLQLMVGGTLLTSNEE
jgi:hypothetical protein